MYRSILSPAAGRFTSMLRRLAQPSAEMAVAAGEDRRCARRHRLWRSGGELTWLFFEGRDKDQICRDLGSIGHPRVLLHRAKNHSRSWCSRIRSRSMDHGGVKTLAIERNLEEMTPEERDAFEGYFPVRRGADDAREAAAMRRRSRRSHTRTSDHGRRRPTCHPDAAVARWRCRSRCSGPRPRCWPSALATRTVAGPRPQLGSFARRRRCVRRAAARGGRLARPRHSHASRGPGARRSRVTFVRARTRRRHRRIRSAPPASPRAVAADGAELDVYRFRSLY